jgi:hypothetical protein
MKCASYFRENTACVLLVLMGFMGTPCAWSEQQTCTGHVNRTCGIKSLVHIAITLNCRVTVSGQLGMIQLCCAFVYSSFVSLWLAKDLEELADQPTLYASCQEAGYLFVPSAIPLSLSL